MTKEKLKEFINEGFNGMQISEIAKGYMNCIPENLIEIYAKPEFNAYQMAEIREGIQNNLPIDNVLWYAKPEIDSNYMSKLRILLQSGKSIKQIIDIINLELNCRRITGLIYLSIDYDVRSTLDEMKEVLRGND